METILVPLDGSPLAEQVLPFVKVLAQALTARIHLQRVLTGTEHAQLRGDPSDRQLRESGPPPDSLFAREQLIWDILRRRARSYLATLAQQLQALGYGATYSIDIGEPASCIAETATQFHASLIALASHGYGGLRRWAVGSVTDELLQATSLPILVVRSSDHAQAAPALRRIMVPLDGSADAHQALPLACELARRAQAELLLVQTATAPVAVDVAADSLYALPAPEHARPEGVFAHDEQTLRELETLADTLRQEGVAAKPLLSAGDVPAVIVEEAAAHHVDLIVLATRDHSDTLRWWVKGVVGTLLHTTPAPLLLVQARPAV
jgi:nucleotide-binding universal stress UspA family protein